MPNPTPEELKQIADAEAVLGTLDNTVIKPLKIWLESSNPSTTLKADLQNIITAYTGMLTQ
jgi:hypothetical protein